MIDFVQARRNMVDCQLRTFDVNDRALLTAMAELPRELFVPQDRADLAYLDTPIECVGGPRKMLAPMVLARLVQALGIETGMRVLDVAGGAGYSGAILSRLGAEVVLLESEEQDVSGVPGRLASLGLSATIVSGPLEKGAPKASPFDAILVNGLLETKPDALLAQLSPDGGRLATLRRENGTARAVLYVRSGDAIGSRALFDANAPVLAAFRPAPEFVF